MALTEMEAFLELVRKLRKECPWDRKQTHRSLAKYLLEEAHETIEAIETGKPEPLCEELGDVLLQVVLHSVLAEEKGRFTLEGVAESIRKKMIRRHPHLFTNGKSKGPKTAKEQTAAWSKLKQKERKEGLLSTLPRTLPALQRAGRLGEIAASVGFDWPGVDDVLLKVEEELGELRREIRRKKRNRRNLELELGDLLFVLTRLAAHLNLDAESSLQKSSTKFQKRFEKMERVFQKRKEPMADQPLDQLEAVWKEAKLRIR